MWNLLGMRRGGLWEGLWGLWGSRGLQGGLKGLGSKNCNISQLKTPERIKMSILRGVFEGRCHQVM
jgi:hypothetical protein